MQREHLPALYRSADDLSNRSQHAFYRVLFWHLAFLAAATAISVANSADPRVAIAQALVLLAALGCALYLFYEKPERLWYGARAVAESAKTSAWRFACRAEPFDQGDELDIQQFRQVLAKIVEQNRDIAAQHVLALGDVQITPEMLRIRTLSFDSRAQLYLDDRIIDQQNWYASKARSNRQAANTFFALLVLTIFLALALAIAKVSYPTVSFWPTDVFVTVAASVLAWIQSKRFQELAGSYALAAHEISFIRDQAGRIRDEAEFAVFVADAENAFSREHTQWVARKDA